MSNEQIVGRNPEYRRLIESLRVMLAIIAGLLMLDAEPQVQTALSTGVVAFSIYAVVLLWFAAKGSFVVQHRIFYWLDAGWFLLLVALAGASRTHYFLFLFFPIFFAVWRSGYRLGIEISAVTGCAALIIFAVREPDISWVRLVALPLSLFVVGPVFVALATIEVATLKSREFASSVVERLDARTDFRATLAEILEQLGSLLGASSAILAIRTFDGQYRVYCWEEGTDSFLLSENVSQQVAGQVLALSSELAFGYAPARHWWQRLRQFGLGSNGTPNVPAPPDAEKLATLGDLIGTRSLMSVCFPNHGIGSLRLLIGGDAMEVTIPTLESLVHIVGQVFPSIENIYLRERLATEAADTERARIGRDLHDSALQPYIGLKFALEALKRRTPPDNPVAPDLDRMVEMATEELASMREVISGLRGTPGKGSALLASAVRRQALRFSQLFGIQVDVVVEGEMPVSRRIAGEIFHIVAEGLSNIRRHTKARRASINLQSSGDTLVITISNENTAETLANLAFQPRSLSERAAELGGSVEVESKDANTIVTVRIPAQPSKGKS